MIYHSVDLRVYASMEMALLVQYNELDFKELDIP